MIDILGELLLEGERYGTRQPGAAAGGKLGLRQ